MAGFDVFCGGLGREHGSGGMRVEVEEVVSLVADEVVAAAGSAACDTNALGKFESCLECSVVGWSDFFDSEADSKDDQGGLELVVCVFLSRYLRQGVDVDIAIVGTSVDLNSGFVVLLRERTENS